MTTKTLPPFYR